MTADGSGQLVWKLVIRDVSAGAAGTTRFIPTRARAWTGGDLGEGLGWAAPDLAIESGLQIALCAGSREETD